MKVSDAAMLLTAARVFDYHIGEPDELTAQGWASALDGLDPGDCLDAIRLYYREHTERIMPAHIIAYVRQAKEDAHRRETIARLREERAALEAGRSVDVGQVGQRVPAHDLPTGWDRVRHDAQVEALTRQCGFCGAPVGQPCTNNGRAKATVHPSRCACRCERPVEREGTGLCAGCGGSVAADRSVPVKEPAT